LNNQNSLRGGLIGCGFFAENHLFGWREAGGAEIVAVCDLERDKVERAAAQFDIDAVYTDAEQMLRDEQLNFVDIVTTMDSHRVLVELAAKHAVPAIVQKPFAPTLADAEAMVLACQQQNITLMVHENFRWRRPMMAVRELVDQGVIGQPFFGRVSWRHANPVGYANQPYLFEQEQFIINDVGIHLLDLARFYFGEAERVYSEVQNVNSRFKGEDVATLLLRHSNGVTSIVELSVSSVLHPDPFPQTLVYIEGRSGTLELRQDYVLKISTAEGSKTLDVKPRIYNWGPQGGGSVQESVVNIQQHWIDCLREGRTPDTSGADNLKSLQLVFSAYESAEQGRAITVPN